MRHAIYVCFLCAFVICTSVATKVYGECIPSSDPCTPKKVLNEWEKSLIFGFNLTQGNSETMLLGLGGKAHKEEGNEIMDFSFLYNYGEDSTNKSDSDSDDDTTRNDLRAEGSYDQLISERTYFGVGSSFLYDEIADVDYRVSIDPSPGYFFLKDNTIKLSAEAGPSYIFEKQGEEENNYFAPRIANKFEWAITCTSKVFELTEMYFDVSDSKNILVSAEVGIEAAISTNLALVLSVREDYDNVPTLGRDKGDLAIMTSLKVSI